MLTRKEVLQKLGSRISRLRQKRGFSIEKLAYEMGMSKGNLSNIENGKRDPRLTTLRAIAMGLQVPIAALFRDIE
jgi:transcriptional regulator with XRE-family HTH domain